MRDRVLVDEREAQFDVRHLESGDPVEVFVDEARGWLRGTYRVRAGGEALVELVAGDTDLGLHRALKMGLRRVLH